MFRLLSKTLSLLIDLAILLCIPVSIIGFWFYHSVLRDLPPVLDLDHRVLPQASFVFSRDGRLMGEFFKERRYFTPFKEIPPSVINAFIAAEDLNFFNHPGIDFLGILRALIVNLKEGRIKQGGSTITQQVVKNLLLTREKSITRKIQEAVLAFQIENYLSKEQILELYLNLVFLGNNSFGVASAAKNYFRKELSELTLAEATLLAGLPQAPSKYSPLNNFKLAKSRQRYVLNQMIKGGMITRKEAEQVFAQKVTVYPANLENYYLAPYYLSEVRKELEEILPEIDIDSEGLRIETFLISDFQAAVEQAVNEKLIELDRSYGYRGPVDKDQRTFYRKAVIKKIDKGTRTIIIEDASGERVLSIPLNTWLDTKPSDEGRMVRPFFDRVKVGDYIEISSKMDQIVQTPEVSGVGIIINPKGGEVLALHGGFAFRVSQFNRATQANRQAGSAFKPIVYLTALSDFRYTPATVIVDAPRSFRMGGQIWSPSNYDGKFEGRMTLTRALERSRNLPAVLVTANIGVSNVINVARELGIESKLPRNLTISLGSGDVTPLELTRAYGVICSEGVNARTRYVKRVFNSRGQLIYDSDQSLIDNVRQAVDPRASFILTNMMKYVAKSGTAAILRDFPVAVAGKTGTTNEFMDAWFIACTPELVGGVWFGFDFRRSLGDKMTGGKVAAPVWKQMMTSVYSSIDATGGYGIFKKVEDFAETEGVKKIYFHPVTGRISKDIRPGFYVGYVREEDFETLRGIEEEGGDQANSSISQTEYFQNPDL